MKQIILRHDIDREEAATYGLDICIEIERLMNVRSTIFLRYDRKIGNDKSKHKKYLGLEKQGWEFGLHLSNHENKPQYDKPEHELKVIRDIGLQIHGLAACGSMYNWHDPNGYNVQDSLGLKYLCPSSLKIPNPLKSYIMPPHYTIDGGYLMVDGTISFKRFINDIEEALKLRDCVAVLSHPQYFLGMYVQSTKENLKLGEFYIDFLNYFKDKVKFIKYIDYYGSI